MEQLRIKISAKTVSNRRFSWSVAIPKDFFLDRADLPPKSRLIRKNDRFCLEFSDEGIKSSSGFLGNYRWLTFNKTEDIGRPMQAMSATELPATFNNETNTFEVDPQYYPPILKYAMDHPESATEPGVVHKPVSPKKSGKLVHVLKRPSDMPAVRSFDDEQDAATTIQLPPRVLTWNDTNVRMLQQLIRECQVHRPEVVFQIINGVVIMKKVRFEEI